MLQQNEPEDYVVGTGKTWSVQQLVETAFGVVGLNWQDYVKINEKFLRPAEVDLLVADPSKANTKLNWHATTSFETMIEKMVHADLERHSHV